MIYKVSAFQSYRQSLISFKQSQPIKDILKSIREKLDTFIRAMMTKVITSLGLVCLTLLALPNSLHGRYLLVELDGASSPAEGGEEPMVPEVPEVPEEPVPEDAEVPETLPEYDQEEPVDPVTQKPVPRRRQAAKKGFRAGNTNI